MSAAPPHLRVLLTTDAVGGVWSYSLDLAHAFAEAGAAVDLAILGPASATAGAAQIRHQRITLHQTGLPLEWLGTKEEVCKTRDALRRLAAELHADSVQLHSPALVGGGPWPCPVIAAAHSCVGTWWQAVRGAAPLPPDLAWRAAMVAEGLGQAEASLCPTAAFAAALRSLYGALPRLSVIHNGRAMPTAVVRDAGASAILTAGRLWDEAKNAGLLDTVAGETGLVIAAAGASRAPFGSSRKLPHLTLLGPLDSEEMGKAYAGAGIFASPALYEPFGLAVLEAAQAGLALVLSDIPTFRELWDGCALFLPSRDAGAWGDQLRSLQADPARYTRLGSAAHARAAEYTATVQAKDTWSLHRSCILNMKTWEPAA